MEPILKRCEFCKKEFEAKRRSAKLCSQKCINDKWRMANPEKWKATRDKWRTENPEKWKAARRKWKKENPEKRKAARKKWKKENPEKQGVYSKNWSAAHPQRRRELQRDYYDKRGCALETEKQRRRSESIKQDPVKYQAFLAKRREYARTYHQRQKIKRERDAWRADPINAARIAAINEQRLSAEEREAALDKAQEESYRKEVRAETRKNYAAQQVTKESVENNFPGVFDLEWSDAR